MSDFLEDLRSTVLSVIADQVVALPSEDATRALRDFYTFASQDDMPNPFSAPETFPFCCSTVPFTKLNRTSMDQLDVGLRSTGTFLLLRCLEVQLKNNVLYLVAEDHKGKSSLCQVYNFVFINQGEDSKAKEFPTGTVFVIKEPWLKKCIDGSSCLFVTSPSDIFILKRDHSLFEEAVKLGWKATTGEPNSALGWKEKGNVFFRSKNYFKALEAYSMGLRLDLDGRFFTVLHLNLAAAFLMAECYESCLEHTSQALSKEPTNEKALFRAGRAHYKLGQYEDAETCFEKLLVEHVSKEALYEHERCRKRLLEREGKIDLRPLMCEITEDPSMAGFGKYLGPVQVRPVPGKGRGLVAMEDLKPGSLVLAETAFASFTTALGCRELHIVSSRSSPGLTDIIRKVYLNPKTFGKAFFDLHAGDKHGINTKLFCDENYQSEPIVDIEKVWGTVSTNSFAGQVSADSPGDVFLTASYINHSCLCNSMSIKRGKLMTVWTTTLVRKGEEISFSYCGVPEPPLSESRNRSFVCSCQFCELERRDPEELRMGRVKLVIEFIALVACHGINGRGAQNPEIKRIVKELEESYRGRKQLTTALFRPYLYLAYCLKLEDQQASRKSKDGIMELTNKALKCLGLSLDILIKLVEDQNRYFPRDAFISKRKVILEVANFILSVQNRKLDVELWTNIIRILGNLFLLKFPVQLSPNM